MDCRVHTKNLIREYCEDDRHDCSRMLADEGYSEDRMFFTEYQTRVYDDGDAVKAFFTFKESHGFPHLIHFVVGRPYREAALMWRMMKEFSDIVKAMGEDHAIMDCPVTEPRRAKAIMRRFGVLPYEIKNGTMFFLVEVR